MCIRDRHSSGNDPLGAQMHGDFSPTKVSMGKSGLRRIQRRVHDRQQLLGLRGRKGNPDSGRELCCVGFPQTDMLSSCLFRNEYADRMGLHLSLIHILHAFTRLYMLDFPNPCFRYGSRTRLENEYGINR